MTPRQQQVWSCIAQGMSRKDIARSLGVTVPTVRCHLRAVADKCGTTNHVLMALQFHGIRGHERAR
jgi:DNA-binding NarL/FixJ family response regulator